LLPSREQSGNWRIEQSIDINQNLGLTIAADPILLTAVAVVGQPELEVFAALGDVIDQARFRRCEDQHPRGIGHAPRIGHALPFIERRRIDPLKLGHGDGRTDQVAAVNIEGFFPCSIIGIFAVRYGLILCSIEYGNGFRDSAMLMHWREPDELGGPQICRFRNSEKSNSAGFMDQESSNRTALVPAIVVSNTAVRPFAEI